MRISAIFWKCSSKQTKANLDHQYTFRVAIFRLIVTVPTTSNLAIDLQGVVGTELNDDVRVQYHEGNVARWSMLLF